jgi:branched-chain amino acid aminotransferase
MAGEPARIAMWSGPRTVSTALMRAWENRPDTVVADEPLYAFYLDRTGLAHPAREQVIASQPASWQTVIRQLTSRSAARRTLRANAMTDGVHIRLTLTRGVKITSGMDPRLNQSGPTLIVLAEHKDPVYDQSGITLITSSVRRPPPDVLDPRIHHNNLLPSILAKIEANVAGAGDAAVTLDSRGFVAETNATHLFLVTAGRLGTPTAAACPEGITRAAVLELAADAGIPHTAGDYSLTQFYAADEVFVTGTMGGLTPVIELDGRPIGTGAPGIVTKRLSDLYDGLTARSGTLIT